MSEAGSDSGYEGHGTAKLDNISIPSSKENILGL